MSKKKDNPEVKQVEQNMLNNVVSELGIPVTKDSIVNQHGQPLQVTTDSLVKNTQSTAQPTKKTAVDNNAPPVKKRAKTLGEIERAEEKKRGRVPTTYTKDQQEMRDKEHETALLDWKRKNGHYIDPSEINTIDLSANEI